ELLGRRFSLAGPVVAGEARGRTLGYPTANIDPPAGAALPADGVYLTLVEGAAPGSAQPALTVISEKPSFGGGARSVESFLLDFAGDLYGRAVEIAFCARLREIR